MSNDDLQELRLDVKYLIDQMGPALLYRVYKYCQLIMMQECEAAK